MEKENKDFDSTEYSGVSDAHEAENIVLKNIEKHAFALTYYRWYYDIFVDLFRDKSSMKRLHRDQRVLLRALGRFKSVSGIFARSYAKTFTEVLADMISCILFPGIQISISAQTKQNAASILKDKYGEVLSFFPGLELEVSKSNFSKDTAEIYFSNGSKLDILANQQSSKGQRRHRLNAEESALIDKGIYEDAIEPIVDNARLINNNLAISSPLELNRQINFFTTAYYKASNEYKRINAQVQNMLDLNGEIVLGSDWRLNSWYGRGANKSTVKKKKNSMNPVSFAMNYESKFVGADTDALVDMNKVIALRVIEQAEFEGLPNEEYYMAVDVARSGNTQNCQSSISVMKVTRKVNNRIKKAKLVYLVTILGDVHFDMQALKIKQIREAFGARVCVVDKNGLGVGLCDELMKTQYDGSESYTGWGSINTDDKADTVNPEKVLYILAPQSEQSDIISTFISCITSGEIEFLKSIDDFTISEDYINMAPEQKLPHIHTDLMMNEIANLKLKTLPSGNLSIEPIIKRLGKDRFSSTAYCLWYIKSKTDNSIMDNSGDLSQYICVY